MEIQKIYSSYDDERIYSVLMTEDELERFYSRADYAGLDEKGINDLKRMRSMLARDLNVQRKRMISLNYPEDIKRKYLDNEMKFIKDRAVLEKDQALRMSKTRARLSSLKKAAGIIK